MSNDEIHYDFVVYDNQNFYNFSRLIFFPNNKMALIIFFNSQSIVDERISESLTKKNLDEKKFDLWNRKILVFKEITGFRTNYYLYFNKENFIKFFNYLGGINMMLLRRIDLINSQFVYLNKKMLFFGEKLYDYISLDENLQDQTIMEVLEKQYRFQNFFINFIYQLPSKKQIFTNEVELKVLSSFMETNLEQREIKNFFLNLIEYDFLVMEMPLIHKRIGNNDSMILHIEKSRQIYKDTKSRFEENQSDEETITMEIFNAASINRLANNVKSYIHSKTLQVLGTDTYPEELESTVLIDNKGNSKKLKKLEKLLNVSRENIFYIKRISDVEFTFILGKDFNIKTFLKRR